MRKELDFIPNQISDVCVIFFGVKCIQYNLRGVKFVPDFIFNFTVSHVLYIVPFNIKYIKYVKFILDSANRI